MPRQIVVCFVALTLASIATSANAQDVRWSIAPYIFAADVGADLTINNNPVLGSTLPFGEVLDRLEAAFMLRAEARRDKFGAFADVFSVSLADTSTVTVGPGGPLAGDLETRADMDTLLIEIGGDYRFEIEQRDMHFDVLVGIRFVELDTALDITLPGPLAPLNLGVDVSEIDFMLGGRLVGQFADRWRYRLRADYAGGGTDGTINALATIGYTFGETDLFTLEGGYRHLSMDITNSVDGGGQAKLDLTLSGPLVGFVFRF